MFNTDGVRCDVCKCCDLIPILINDGIIVFKFKNCSKITIIYN